MAKKRCPECGYLTEERECPICMVRIPGNAAAAGQTRVNPTPRQTAAYPQPRRTATYTPPRKKTGRRTGPVKAVLIIVVLMISLLSTAMEYGMWDSFTDIDLEIPEAWTEPEEYETEEVSWTGSVPHIEETVIWDQDGVTVTAAGMEFVWGEPAVYLTVENNTDGDIELYASEVAVNGCLLEMTCFHSIVEAGETVTDELCLYEDDLINAGIEVIGDVSFALYCSDGDYNELFQSEWITLETDDAGNVKPTAFSGKEIHNGGGLRVEYLDASVEDGDGEIRFLIENYSDVPLAVWGEEMTVNGEEAEDGWLFAQLQPGYYTVYTVDLYDIGKLDVDTAGDLEEMSMVLDVDDMENWEPLLDQVEVTFEFGENG